VGTEVEITPVSQPPRIPAIKSRHVTRTQHFTIHSSNASAGVPQAINLLLRQHTIFIHRRAASDRWRLSAENRGRTHPGAIQLGSTSAGPWGTRSQERFPLVAPDVRIQKCVNSSVYTEIRTDVREIRPQIRVIFCDTNLRTVFLASACFVKKIRSLCRMSSVRNFVLFPNCGR
jgi:hypothetical protein